MKIRRAGVGPGAIEDTFDIITDTRGFNGIFWTVYVRVPGALVSPKEETSLQEFNELTRNLGGEMVELEGESVADAIVNFAVEHQATFIVMGQSVRSRMEDIICGSVITRIMRGTKEIDVLAIAN